MSIWLDFLQVAFALGIGWLGWVLFASARPVGWSRVATSRGRASGQTMAARSTPSVMNGQVIDSDR
jgi:hypothetical protein